MVESTTELSGDTGSKAASIVMCAVSSIISLTCIWWYYLQQPEQPFTALHVVAVVYCLALNFMFYSNQFLVAIPMLILTVPGLVDDLMPSIFLGPTGERGANPYPLISYLDLSLWMFFLYTLKSQKSPCAFFKDKTLKLLFLLLVAAMVSIAANIYSGQQYEPGFGIIWVVYYVRFMLLYVLLDMHISNRDQFKYLVVGVALSIFVLLLDSAYITYAKGLHRLTAGTLGNNVFANLLAACCVLMVGLKMHLSSNWHPPGGITASKGVFCFTKTDMLSAFIVFSTAVAVIMIVATKARMGLIALTFGFGVYWYLKRKKKFTLLGLLKLAGLVVAVAIVLVLVSKATPIFDRFNVNLSDFNTNNVEETKWSEGNTSIVTRILLWKSSAGMIQSNPLTGVGPGAWNASKYAYGFKQNVLIDSHNGYLHFWAENGGIAMLLYISLILVTLSEVRKNLKLEIDYLYVGFAAAFIAWLLTELTNAGINKSRVSTFVVLVIYVLNNFYKKHAGCKNA